MIRRILALCIAMIIVLSIPFTALASDSIVIDFGDVAGEAGDINVDTYITAADLVLLKKILLGKTEPQSMKTANVNQMGGVDIKDLVRLKKIMIEVFGDFINYRTPLTHTYTRLTQDKELKVLYFGGSVTAGTGSTSAGTYSWRALSGNWLKNKFPEADITTINTAIGESGTFLGTYRIQDDVIAKNPDLIFIEYAINDHYKGSSKEVAALQYETIVREIRTALPKCDIVTLLVTDKDVVSRDKLYDTAAGHEEMAEYYGISTVNVGQYLWDTIGQTKNDWYDYFTDIVHPTDLGYKIYFQCLEEYLTNSLSAGVFTGLTDNDKVINPEIKSDYLLDGNRIAAMGYKLSNYVDNSRTTGFSYANEYFAGGSDNLHTGYYQTSGATTNAQIAFNFNGTEFAFWTNFRDSSEITYSIDDGEWVTVECHKHAPMQVVTGLEVGGHTIVIKPSKYKSGIDAMKIHAIFTRDETLQTVKAN